MHAAAAAGGRDAVSCDRPAALRGRAGVLYGLAAVKGGRAEDAARAVLAGEAHLA